MVRGWEGSSLHLAPACGLGLSATETSTMPWFPHLQCGRKMLPHLRGSGIGIAVSAV